MIDNKFGQYLKLLRKSYGINQSELGKILEITTTQVSFYESGKSLPSLELVQRICHIFNIPISQLAHFQVRENFYYREVASQESVQLQYVNSKAEVENFEGIAGLINVPETCQQNYGDNQQFEKEPFANFMLLRPSGSGIVSRYFEDNFDKLPIQKYEELFNYDHWMHENPQYVMEGYPLLINMLVEMNKGVWLANSLCQPATNENILALSLSNGRIIRLYIQSWNYGAKLHAYYNKELENQINVWCKLSLKERVDIGRQFCLKSNLNKTEYDNTVDKLLNNDGQDLKSNLMKYLNK